MRIIYCLLNALNTIFLYLGQLKRKKSEYSSSQKFSQAENCHFNPPLNLLQLLRPGMKKWVKMKKTVKFLRLQDSSGGKGNKDDDA